MSATEAHDASSGTSVGKVDMKLEKPDHPRCQTWTEPSSSMSAGLETPMTTSPRWRAFASSSSPRRAPGSSVHVRPGPHNGRARLGRGQPDRLRYRGRHMTNSSAAASASVDIWHGPPFAGRGTATRPRPRARQLRIVLLLHRSRQQYVDRPGGNDPASRSRVGRLGHGDRGSGRSAPRDGRAPRPI